MKKQVEEFIATFRAAGLLTKDEEETKAMFKKERKTKDFDVYEEWALRNFFDGTHGLLVVDKDKFVQEMEEMSQTDKKVFCMFGTATLIYSELGDKFHVSTGGVKNLGLKMMGELEKGTIQIEDFVPEEEIEEIELKMVFEKKETLRVLFTHLRQKTYDLHREINKAKKLTEMREKVRNPMKEIYGQQKIKIENTLV